MDLPCNHCRITPAEGEAFKLCGRCKTVRYCSEGCQRAAWKDHRISCQIPGDPDSSKAATTLTPAKCGACKKTANFLCNGCRNLGYCHMSCQEKNMSFHKALCDSFSNLPTRPGPNFYRAIFFPADKAMPHFVWLEFEGYRTNMRMSEGEQKKYLGDGSIRSVYSTRDVKSGREFDHQYEVHHRDNFIWDGSAVNMSLAPFIGSEHAPRWRGPLLAQGGKYSHEECDFSKIDKENYDSDCDTASEMEELPLIPMDLDTTSLDPIIRYMKHIGEQQQSMDSSGNLSGYTYF